MNGLSCGVPIVDFPVPSHRRGAKQTYAMTPKGIVIHNTWNNAPSKNEASYMVGNPNMVSFHTVIDENVIYECIPFTRNSWHCGATYGNRNYIGIEIARSRSDVNLFKKAEDNTARYVVAILKKYGWGLDKVYTHQQQSGKYCPHKTLDLGWNRFMQIVKKYYNNGVSVPEKREKAGYSLTVIVDKNDELKVRKTPDASSREVSSYRPNSVIWASEKVTTPTGEVWYKISDIGYVHSAFCKKVEKYRPPVVLYLNEGDKDVAILLGKLLDLPVHRDDGTRTKENYDIKYVGGQGKNRRETAKYVFNTYL